jgi:VanZ family protein
MTSSASHSDRRRLIWPVALALTITWCSARPVEGLPPTFEGSDKVVHFLLFGLMATLVARIEAVQQTRPLGRYAASLVVSVFGVTDELHQHFTPGRSMDFWDWVADSLGAVLATVLYTEWHRYRRVLESPVLALFRKRRIETESLPCVIAADGRS